MTAQNIAKQKAKSINLHKMQKYNQAKLMKPLCVYICVWVCEDHLAT